MIEETRVCIVCGIPKPLISFGKLYNNGKIYGRRRVCEYCRKNRFYHKLRLAFLTHFNFRCQCCGESDIRFLTLDHVQNDGYKDRNLVPIQALRKAYDDNFDKTKWNCLCWNCNCARGQYGGICPHKLQDSKDRFLEKYKLRASDGYTEMTEEEITEVKLNNLVKNLEKDEIQQLMHKLINTEDK